MAEEISAEGLPTGYTLLKATPEYYVLSDGERYAQWPVTDGLDYDRVLKHAVAALEKASGRDNAG